MADADLNKAWNQLQDKLNKSGRSAMVILPPQAEYTNPSPPPDVVEAARRLEDGFENVPEYFHDVETVCNWVLGCTNQSE